MQSYNHLSNKQTLDKKSYITISQKGFILPLIITHYNFFTIFAILKK